MNLYLIFQIIVKKIVQKHLFVLILDQEKVKKNIQTYSKSLEN